MHIDDSEREFRDEVVSIEKVGYYYGEWDPKSNQPNGYGFWIWNDGKMVYENYFKQGLMSGYGRAVGVSR